MISAINRLIIMASCNASLFHLKFTSLVYSHINVVSLNSRKLKSVGVYKGRYLL